MSISSTREFSRAILRPLCISTELAPLGRDGTDRKSPENLQSWTSTTHTFVGTQNRTMPSAWPASRFSQDPAQIPDDSTHDIPYLDEDGMSSPKRVSYQWYDEKHDSNAPESVPPPQIVVKRFIPAVEKAPSAEQMTLLVLPGMGASKEMLEPILADVLSRHQDQNHNIGEIWSVDMPLSGDTALVNPIGYAYGDEKDIARDLMLFITSYLPLQMRGHLPSELIPRRPKAQGSTPVRKNLHVIAHSLGAQSSILIATHAPSLFASLTLMDPAIVPPGKIRDALAAKPKDILCTNIRYEHSNRETLIAHLKANRRTRTWDERIMNIFATHAVTRGKDGALRLKAHPRLEWALYYDKTTPSETFDRLKDLRVPVNFIMPKAPFATPPKMLDAIVRKLPQKTQLTWIDKAMHQLPYEHVDRCAELISQWLSDYASAPSAKL